jgi:Uri superfamily endonuclease
MGVMKDAGTYALVIYLNRGLSLSVGALGSRYFPLGYYIYTGSALAGLGGRLGRHLRSGKVRHWHIDYLLAEARVVEAWCCLSRDRLECRWGEAACALPGAAPLIDGFGSSDCRCRTHLLRLAAAPSLDAFNGELDGRGLPQARRFALPVSDEQRQQQPKAARREQAARRKE